MICFPDVLHDRLLNMLDELETLVHPFSFFLLLFLSLKQVCLQCGVDLMHLLSAFNIECPHCHTPMLPPAPPGTCCFLTDRNFLWLILVRIEKVSCQVVVSI